MKLEFQIWDAADAHDRQAWIERWSEWPGREVFGHPDYVRLYAGANARAVCAAASFGGSHILYPFLLREIGGEPFCECSLRDCTDIATAYGYGGPFGWGSDWTREALEWFWQWFRSWGERSRVVSEFVRLSLFPRTVVDYPGCCRSPFNNVVVPLKKPEELWPEFEPKVRKNVKKAVAGGVKVLIDETGERLDDFLAIYAGTMDRHHAQQGYYFPREYFERIHRDLSGQFAYFHAMVGETVVSTELVLVSADRVYSFLGGTDAAWFPVRPNDLLKVEIMNWAHSLGKSEFVLGGGYNPGDGIYRFKLSFAPKGSVPFSVGSRIFNSPAYDELVMARQRSAARAGVEWQPAPEYFPSYRG